MRLFIHCEGRIRDLEKSLGISYPTVKARIADIKSKLCMWTDQDTRSLPNSTSAKGTSHNGNSVARQRNRGQEMSILNQLDGGEISFEEALEKIKQK